MKTDIKPSKHPRLKWTLLILFFVIIGLLVKFIVHLVMPRNFAATGEMLPLSFTGAPFQISYYCGSQQPKGIVILGTGDGGWSYWEENTAKHFSAKGYAVGGWDCRKFADSRVYDQAQLSAAFRAAADDVRKRSGADDDAPVWYGGWSTGAEQAVAAASGDRAPNLTGLLLAAPGSRGRYGITTSDLLGKQPAGPDTFALADLAPKLGGLRVAQFAAGIDPMDDVKWLDKLSIPHRIFALPGKLHDMGGAGHDFQTKLDEAIAWTLQNTR